MTTRNPHPPRTWYGTWSVLRRNVKVWRRFFFSGLVGNLAEPFLYLMALGYGLGALVTEVEGVPYIAYIAPGLIISAVMYGATFEGTYGTFTRLVPQHTFEGILATPIGPTEITLAEMIFAACKGAVAGCTVLLVATCFGLVASWTALWIPFLGLVVGFLFGALSVLVAAASPSYDFFNYYFTLVSTPMFLFSGIFFPLDQLPLWAQMAAWFNPMTHGVDLARGLFTGVLTPLLFLDLAWIVVVAGLVVWPAILLIEHRLIK